MGQGRASSRLRGRRKAHPAEDRGYHVYQGDHRVDLLSARFARGRGRTMPARRGLVEPGVDEPEARGRARPGTRRGTPGRPRWCRLNDHWPLNGRAPAQMPAAARQLSQIWLGGNTMSASAYDSSGLHGIAVSDSAEPSSVAKSARRCGNVVRALRHHSVIQCALDLGHNVPLRPSTDVSWHWGRMLQWVT